MALGLALAACGTASERASQSDTSEKPAQVGQARPGGSAETGVSGAGTQAPLQLTPAQQAEGSANGLIGAEFYDGSGVLVRDPNGGFDPGIGENGRITLNFANAEIRDVIDIVLGDTLGANYVIDSAVQGTITVRTSQPLSRADVVPALENILALNGVALTLVNGTYMVVPQDVAATGLSTPLVRPKERQLARGYGINVIPLNFVSASSMQEILEPFVNPGSLRADSSRNLLIYTGNGNQARDLLDMVKVFDVDWMRGMSFALIPVEVADVKNLVTDLESVFLQDGNSPLAGLIRFVPIERLNAVLAISPQTAYLDRAETWIERLDRGVEGAGRRIFVYYVENGRAEDLADILSQVFDVSVSGRRGDESSPLAPGLTPTEIATAPAAGAEGTTGQTTQQTTRRQTGQTRESGVGQAVGGLVQESGDIRIIADESVNALLILATAAEFRMIEATLKRLDVLPLQVLIEATIAEVTLTDTLQYGIQWFFEQGDFSTTFSTIAGGAVNSVFPGFSFLADFGSDGRGVLNALTDITDVKVISSPQLMVLDNQTARLQVGDQVPFPTQSSVSDSTGDTLTTSFQQLDTGVVLEVTPRVNTGGLVTLEISQEVSTPVLTTSSTSTEAPTIQQRSIESTVAIQNGDSVALGGLIRDDRTDSTSGVPILSEIPILGNLFKVTTDTTVRTELLVLITPRVVHNRGEAQKVTDELRERLKSIEPLQSRIAPVPTE